MKVSFIIIALNAEKDLNNILENLYDQDYPKQLIEVILIDSGSSNKCKNIMIDYRNKYKNEYNNIIVEDNYKKYLPCGWNIALSLSSGDIIIRVDAHTIIRPDFIKRNVFNIKNGEFVSGGRVISINNEKTIISNIMMITDNSLFAGGVASFRRSKTKSYLNSVPFAAYRKEVFEKVGKYDERYFRTEDNEMHYRMRKAGYKLLFDPEIVTYRKARSTLKGLLRQKYGNGFCIGNTFLINPKCYSLRHLVPFIFFCVLITLLVISATSIYPIILLITTYTVLNILFSINTVTKLKQKWYYILFIPIIHFFIHISYGLGTLIGLTRYILRDKNNE